MPRIKWEERFDTGKLYINIHDIVIFPGDVTRGDNAHFARWATRGSIFLFLEHYYDTKNEYQCVLLVYKDRVVKTYRSAFEYLKRIEPGAKLGDNRA